MPRDSTTNVTNLIFVFIVCRITSSMFVSFKYMTLNVHMPYIQSHCSQRVHLLPKRKKKNGKDVGKRMETHCKLSVNFLEIRSLIRCENCLTNKPGNAIHLASEQMTYDVRPRGPKDCVKHSMPSHTNRLAKICSLWTS